METKILPKSFFEGVQNPQFEDNYDYCLVTPVGENLEMTYFNIAENNILLLRESAGQLIINKTHSVLFCLTPQSELMVPNLGCLVAIQRKGEN